MAIRKELNNSFTDRLSLLTLSRRGIINPRKASGSPTIKIDSRYFINAICSGKFMVHKNRSDRVKRSSIPIVIILVVLLHVHGNETVVFVVIAVAF